MIPFDSEVITARILAEELGDMIERSGATPSSVGAAVGIGNQAVYAWLRGDNLRQPVRLFAVIDALGYDVVFRKRSGARRTVRLVTR